MTIQQSEKTHYGSLIGSFYPNYGLVFRPLIIATETGDLYLHLEYSDSLYNALVQTYEGNNILPEEVSVTVQNNPMVYLVWVGVVLMLLGMSIQFANDLRSTKQEQ